MPPAEPLLQPIQSHQTTRDCSYDRLVNTWCCRGVRSETSAFLRRARFSSALEILRFVQNDTTRMDFAILRQLKFRPAIVSAAFV